MFHLRDIYCWRVKKTRATCILSTRDSLQIYRHRKTESEDMKKVFHTNGNEKKGRVTIFIPIKIDFQPQIATKDKKGR